jgi:serine/threonine protein kinase
MDAAVEPGTLVGERYRVLGLIGEGGMAHVYEVEHTELGRHFALKLLRAHLLHEPTQVERFKQEARAVARLESPHIVGMVDSGLTAGGVPFFVMELFRGCDLRHVISREGPLSAARTLHIGLDVCRGLAVAHAAGIVHRDLKPENLFVTRDAEGKEQCKLLDFGIAKLGEGNATVPGTLVGTVRYMAPEQLGSNQSIGPTTDLFSLGVTLFECLTGRPPFDADTFERVLFKIMNDPAPDLLGFRPDLQPAFAALVTQLLAKEPGKRPTSAKSLAADLSRCLAPPPARGAAAAKLNATLDARPASSALRALEAPRSARDARRSLARRLPALLALGALAGLVWLAARRATRDVSPGEAPLPQSSGAKAPQPAPSSTAAPAVTATSSAPATLPTAAASAVVSAAPRTAVVPSRPPPRNASSAARIEATPASTLPLFYPRRAKAP